MPKTEDRLPSDLIWLGDAKAETNANGGDVEEFDGGPLYIPA
jgi:hypothetical protein